jgi:hypothetical protein
MPNRNLSASELQGARELLDYVRERLDALSHGDAELLFAFRRKVYKELTYDERGKPSQRNRLKAVKRLEQNGLCPLCSELLPETYCVLDRFNAADGYTAGNTRLIHQQCDVGVQSERKYA